MESISQTPRLQPGGKAEKAQTLSQVAALNAIQHLLQPCFYPPLLSLNPFQSQGEIVQNRQEQTSDQQGNSAANGLSCLLNEAQKKKNYCEYHALGGQRSQNFIHEIRLPPTF